MAYWTWFVGMATYFLVFTLLVLYYEVQAAWLLVTELERQKEQRKKGGSDSNNNGDGVTAVGLKQFLMTAILHRQNSNWSGRYHTQQLEMAEEGQATTKDDDNNAQMHGNFFTPSQYWITRFILASP